MTRVTLISHSMISPRQWLLGWALAKLGVETQVVSPFKWGPERLERERVRAVQEMDELRGVKKPEISSLFDMVGVVHVGDTIYTYTMPKAKAYIEKFEPDWIYAQAEPCSFQAVMALQWAKELGCRYCCFSWENLLKPHVVSTFENIEKMVLRDADVLIAGSSGAKEVMVKKGAEASKIFVIPQTGIDTSIFKKARTRKEYDLLFTGRLTEEKGVYVIEKAVGTDWKICWGGGKGTFKPKTGVFHGWVSYFDLPKIYSRSKVFLYPSIPMPEKGWVEQSGGYSSMESLACQTPVITTTAGAIPEYLSECKGAVLIEPNNPKQLRDAIEMLLADEKKRRWMGREGRKFILERYSNTQIAKQLTEVFD